MRVRTFLRERRGGRSLSNVAAMTGIGKGDLSLIERGHLLPRDDQIRAMMPVYGLPEYWWPAGVQHVADRDIRRCRGCGQELPPSASKRRVYHDGCRA